MRLKTGSRAIAALAFVAALGLSGCSITMGSSSEKTSEASSETPADNQASDGTSDENSQAPSDDSSESSDDSSDTGSDNGVEDTSEDVSATTTAGPGTRLKFGDTARLTINKNSVHNSGTKTTGTFDVTVTITKGSNSDFDNAKNKAQFAGMTPYYVHIEHKLISLSQKDAFGNPATTFHGYLQNGQPAGKVTVTRGQFPKCDFTNYPTENVGGKLYTPIGATAKSCNIFVAKAGERVVAASWAPMDDETKASAYIKNPIIWQE